MHVAIVTTEFVTEKSYAGGLANYSANLARMLRENKNAVSVFTISDKDEMFVWENGIQIYRICYNDFPEKIKKLRCNFSRRVIRQIWNLFGKSYLVNKKVREVYKKSKIDIVHYCNSEALALFRSKKMPAVVRLSNYPPGMRHAQQPYFDYKKEIRDFTLAERIQFWAIKRADCVFGPSRNIAELTEKKIKKKVEIVESPFLICKEKIDDSIYRDKLKGKKYFLFYGTLSYLKGIHVIADIIQKFLLEFPEYYFVFIGKNDQMCYKGERISAMDYIYKMAPECKERILYFSPMNNKNQLYSIVQHSEACVFPYRFDNFPNTCVEAMALGKIVIGTQGASFEQLIKDGYNGFLIERENSEELYSKLVNIVKLSFESKRKIEEKALQSISRLNPEVILPQIIKIYNKALVKKEKNI